MSPARVAAHLRRPTITRRGPPTSAWMHRVGSAPDVIDLLFLLRVVGRASAAGLPGFSTSVPWSGPVRAWSGGSGREGVVEGVAEQFVEAGFPGPGLGQVQHQTASGARDAGGDVDQSGAQGGAAGLGGIAPASAPAARV